MASCVSGYKYFKIRREKENYRIFTNQQRLSGSVSSLADAVANEASMAYENPSFSAEPGNADFSLQTLGLLLYLHLPLGKAVLHLLSHEKNISRRYLMVTDYLALQVRAFVRIFRHSMVFFRATLFKNSQTFGPQCLFILTIILHTIE